MVVDVCVCGCGDCQAAAGAATTLHTGVVKGTKTEGKVPLYHVPYDGPWHPSDRKVTNERPSYFASFPLCPHVLL